MHLTSQASPKCLLYVLECRSSSRLCFKFLMFCAIWYHLYNLKIVKNAHGGVLLLVKLQVNLTYFNQTNNSKQTGIY